MLINNLSLKNFKCFEEVDVEFAPITLLTGANSSGKSSLIYSLLAVLQTEQFPFYLSPNGKYVNLGGFEEMIFKNEDKRNFKIKIGTNNLTETIWSKNESNYLPILSNLKIDDKLNKASYKKTEGNSLFKIYHKKKQVFLDIILQDLQENYDIGVIENGTDYVLNFNENNISLAEVMKKTFPIYSIDDSKFNYIGSFRLPPERTYYQKAKAEEKISVEGAGYIDQIIEWEETNPEKLAELAKIMSELELFKEIKSNRFKGGRFELAVKTQENSELAALTDVGFGISQFLPIIVADLQLDDQSCLALSQPEIHLHPKIQALFGNFLANQIKRSEKQYIVETHSEYLLNRIRLLLVKGELKPKDVRVYYFENDGIKTTTHQVEFATDGQIKGAPESFFDTYAVDVMDIALNA